MLNFTLTNAIVFFFAAGNHEQAAAVLEVARALGEIAAQFEDRIVTEATRNLSNNISTSPLQVSMGSARGLLSAQTRCKRELVLNMPVKN